MFNKILIYSQDFISNPPIDDEFYTCPETLPDGRVRNGISSRPVSNRSDLEGLHYDETIYGLRAKLNAGVRLQEVPPLSLNSDPTVVLSQAKTFYNNVMSKFTKLSSLDAEDKVSSDSVTS